MQTEATVLISLLGILFGIYSGIAAIKRHNKEDSRKEGTELTTVIIKLEGISEGISEIKSDLSTVKGDIKDITERLIIAEQSVKLAHARIDSIQNIKEGGK